MKVTIEINIPEPNDKLYQEYLKVNGLEDTPENLVDWGISVQWWGLDLQCEVLSVE